ncbi:MAG: hypothetical protein ABJB66_10650 [Gemmatimonadaceae bacterium]
MSSLLSIVAVVAAGAPFVDLHAQARAPQAVTTIDSLRADGSVKKVPLKNSNAFELFATADLAAGFIRGSGGLVGGMSNEGGPASVNQGAALVQEHVAGGQGGIGLFYPLFEMGFVAGAPPSAYKKIQAVYPGISAATGAGYTTHYWLQLTEPRSKRITAADNQLGKVFSGVTAAADNTCRSDARAVGVGFSLLPMKDCPPTWGSEGFLGKLIVPDSLWREKFNAEKTNFRWDDWRIPRSRIDLQSLVGTQSVYGYMSDYARELKARYGSVVPGGVGAPIEAGYPLGLELRVDAFTYAGTPTQNTQYYQVQMVNRSKDVYGTGIDYDSLYFGLGPGYLFSANEATNYIDVRNNTLYVTKGNTSGKCSPLLPKSYAGTGLGPNCPDNMGFGFGVYTMTWLKSPIGDVRNKLFTNPASPYYNPQSQLADDTITFNHFKPNTFALISQNFTRSMRSGFGMLSSTEANFLDGRATTDLTLSNYAYLFRPETWSGTVPATADARFNKFVPGNQIDPRTNQSFGKWDYDNDGVQDTISAPMCGRFGCAGVYSDSSAGGFVTYGGNVLNTVTAGPFALKAGDTTQFLFAFSWAPDSVGTRLNIERLTAQYLGNFASAIPIPFPVVSAAQSYIVEPASTARAGAGNTPTVAGSRITLRLPRINTTDAYLQSSIAKIRADSTAGDATTLRLLRMNPGILAKLDARAIDNLNDVSIFKSCDNGVTFTTTTGVVTGCHAAVPTNLTSASSIPWVPFARVGYVGGVPSSATVVDEVPSGHEYLYSFVTRLRGLSEFKLVDSSSAGFFVSDISRAFGFAEDSLQSSLLNNPSAIAHIYAPITNAAGTQYARVDTSTVGGQATQAIRIGVNNAQSANATRVFFANQFIVRRTLDTASKATNTTVAARWILPLAATTPTANAPTTNFLAMERQFTGPLEIPISQRGLLVAGTQRSVAGSTKTFIDTIGLTLATPGYVWATADNKPIYVTTDRYTARQEIDQQSSPLFPGFTFRALDSSGTETMFAQELTKAGVQRDRSFLLRSQTDTVNTEEYKALPHILIPFGSGIKFTRGGTYKLTWNAEPWGPGAPFSLTDGLQQTTVNASLAAAAASSTTTTDTSALAIELAAYDATRKLVRAKLPFTMIYTDANGQNETVRFAMVSRANKTRLLGNGKDTVRVTIPDSIWVPGDTLVALHHVETDSTVLISGTTGRVTIVRPDTVVGTVGFRPISVSHDSVGIKRLLVGCTADSAATLRPVNDLLTCNPVRNGTIGSSATAPFAPVNPGLQQVFDLTRTFDNRSVEAFLATPNSIAPSAVAADVATINAVPNPYIYKSDFDLGTGTSRVARIYFTGVPESGILRVYSVSGQFLQEISWTRNDLIHTSSNSPTGDLPYNLKARNGQDLASGLYLFVIAGTGVGATPVLHRGKFVVIR